MLHVIRRFEPNNNSTATETSNAIFRYYSIRFIIVCLDLENCTMFVNDSGYDFYPLKKIYLEFVDQRVHKTSTPNGELV